MDVDGDCFGDARLAAIVQEHADDPFPELRDRILGDIGAFSSATGQQDDMTLMLLRVEQVGVAAALEAGVP
jgi:serine phosphatase RsbU (regulator of sigma subunit)